MFQKDISNVYGLVGYPLGHSFSKAYFTQKFHQDNINAEYLNFELEDISSLGEIITKNSNLRGFNVTIPHKQRIIPLLDCLSPAATAIGAVNVVKRKDGKLVGYNTDVDGFIGAIRPLLGAYEHRHALVLGTGGASKAVAYGLEQMGINVQFVSRHNTMRGFTYDNLSPDIIEKHTIIVNATPLGMYPNVETYPEIPYAGITPRHVCFDLVYNPLETKFMQLCAARGATTSNGLEMLHIQAEEAWKIWNEED